jgi:predicted DNA-binding protein with PD1-like motif
MIYEVTVKQGEKIKEVITQFILQKGWKNVYVTGAIGSVIGVELTTPCRNELPLRCSRTKVENAAEIIQLCGEVMPIEDMDPELEEIYPDKDSPLFVHLHAAVAVSGGTVFGGGLFDGNAFRALRVFMLPLDGEEK